MSSTTSPSWVRWLNNIMNMLSLVHLQTAWATSIAYNKAYMFLAVSRFSIPSLIQACMPYKWGPLCICMYLCQCCWVVHEQERGRGGGGVTQTMWRGVMTSGRVIWLLRIHYFSDIRVAQHVLTDHGSAQSNSVFNDCLKTAHLF